MIDSVHIKRFRCFEDLEIKDLGTVNVLVGDNGSGKTALLEALFMAQLGHPETTGRFRLWRGLGGTIGIAMTRGAYESIWADLFFNMDQSHTIELKTTGSPENTRTVTIAYHPNDSFTIPTPSDQAVFLSGQESDSSTIIPLRFTLDTADGETHTFKPLITPGGLSWGGIAPPSRGAFFSAAFMGTTPPTEVAQQFSDNFSKQKKDKMFLRTIKEVYPQIKQLGLETNLGVSMLYCEQQDLPVKIPLALASGGMHKLISYLLGIASQPNGVVLMDEIENGFYYKTMPKVWEVILAFCKRYKVQVFASTHSMECLQAALPVLRKNEDDFRLIRAERKRERRIVRVFQGDEFEAAMETETEVR